MFRNRWLIALGAIATAFVLVSADAQARVGGGFSGGSRGTRTFSAPPATPTAPTAAPIQRSITQPGNAAPIGQTGIRPGLFGGGLFGGLAAGFLGAGLFGLLFGHGLFGGMAGFASMIGLLLQVVLVVIVARLVFAWWQRRNMPTPAYAAAHPVTGHSFGGVSMECWAAPMYHRPATILPSPSRTMMRLNDCSGTSKPTIRRKTFRPCAQRSCPKCCPISQSSWRAMQAAD